MNTLSVIELFTPSKEGINDFVEKTVDAVQNGMIDPLKLRVYLNAIKECVEKIDKQTRSLQLNEAEKYGQKTFDFLGAKISIKENGTKYDYSMCNDPEYHKLFEALEKAKAAIKEREDFLKALKTPIEIFDKETGEVYTIAPPVKSSETGLSISLP